MPLWEKWRTAPWVHLVRMVAYFVSPREERVVNHFCRMSFSHNSLWKKHLWQESPNALLKATADSKALLSNKSIPFHPSKSMTPYLLCITCNFFLTWQRLWHWCGGFHPSLSWINTWPYSGQTGILKKSSVPGKLASPQEAFI